MDEIQQKIEEFKQSLISQSPLKEILLTCPAVLPAVGLLIGLLLQFYFNLPSFAWLAVLIISLILFLSQKFLVQNNYLIFISVLLCFVCLGSFRLIKQNSPAENDIRKIIKDDFTFAHIRAKVITEPNVAKRSDSYFSKFSYSQFYTTFYAKVISIKTTAGWIPAVGTIKFYISEDVNNLKKGNEFQTFCRLQKFSPPENPGQFDIAEYMCRNGVYFSASVKSANSITILNSEKPKSPFDIKAKFNELAVAALHDDTEPDDDMRLAEALLLGSRTKIYRKLYNDFIKTGLVHLVVLSGLNVGILAGVAWWLAKKTGLLHIGRSIACIIATIVFLLVVPAQSPTLRAGIMFIIFCLARMFDRRASLLNSIAVSAIFLLLIKPTDFLNAGFQLSFAATIGIVLFGPVFFGFLISPFHKFKNTFRHSVLQILLASFSAGCTACLFVAPIIAWHFYQVQLLTAVWTVPAMVPATIIIVLGTFKILLNPLLPTLAYGLGFVVDFSAKILSSLVTLFAKVQFSSITIGKPSVYIVLALYLLLFMWKFFPFKRPARNFIYPAVMILLAIFTVFINKFGKFNSLQLTVLSIGHGQAIFLKTPGNKNFILDAGSMSKSDIGTKIINPYFDYIAADKINSVFISHDDIDHFNGLPEIITQHKCKNIYTTPQFIDSNSKTALAMDDFLKSENFTLKIAPEKIFLNKVTISRLWPPNTPDEIPLNDNESSLVLLVEYAGRKILICADIPQNMQSRLMNLYPSLDVDVIITPHHGSARTLLPEFLTAFKSDFLITSCGMARLSSVSPQITGHPKSYLTCKHGDVTVLINRSGRIKISTFK